MYISRLKLLQFKNYPAQELQLCTQLNCFVGANGMGKTNLLDAIYYLCMGKSYFVQRDAYIIQHDTSFFRLEGDFQLANKKDKLVVKVEAKKRKVLEKNKVAYEKLADHVGQYPVVIIVPDDSLLISEGSEIRRRFIDNTLAQLDAQYLSYLLLYNKVLKQRNALLKQYEGRPVPESLLEVYDIQLKEPAAYIHQQRQAFIQQFIPPFNAAYQAISGAQESVSITYKSHLDQADLSALLQENRERDRILQRTTKGIHKDDLAFYMEERPLKRFASQGQLKSFVLALKLAQYSFLKQAKKKQPILLLDDIFDKLDPQRVEQLISYILEGDFGQVFLSDTDATRVERIVKTQDLEANIFTITNGTAVAHE